MKPLKNYVLLGEVKEDLKTDGGIILTQSVDTGTKPGKILAVGPDVEGLAVGQHVICEWKTSTPVMVDGFQCVLLKDDNVLAIQKDV